MNFSRAYLLTLIILQVLCWSCGALTAGPVTVRTRKIEPSRGPERWRPAVTFASTNSWTSKRISVGIEFSARTWKVNEYDNTWESLFSNSGSSEWAGRDADIQGNFLTLRYAVTPDIGATLRLGRMKGGDNDVNLRPGSGEYSYKSAYGIALDAHIMRLDVPSVDITSRFELNRGKTSEWRRNDEFIFKGDIEEWRLQVLASSIYATSYGNFIVQGGFWYGQILLPYTHESAVQGLPREGGFESDKELGIVLGGGVSLNERMKLVLQMESGAASGFLGLLVYDL